MDVAIVRDEISGYRDFFAKIGVEKSSHPGDLRFSGDLEQLYAHHYATLDEIEQLLDAGNHDDALVLFGAVREFMFEHDHITPNQVKDLHHIADF